MTIEKAVRVGAAAVALGLSLAGAQAAVASADSQDGADRATAADGRGTPAKSRATARSAFQPAVRAERNAGPHPGRAAVPSDLPRPSASVAGPARRTVPPAVGKQAPEPAPVAAPVPVAAVTAPVKQAAAAALPHWLAPQPHPAAPGARPASLRATPPGTLAGVGGTADASILRDSLPAGQLNDYIAGAAMLFRRNGIGDSTAAPVAAVTAAEPAATTADAAIRLAIFGDAGNSYTNGTNFYYSPGSYRRLDLGASGPLQQAVAEMMRSWNPSDVIQLGDEAYNSASSTMLDYNIGQYYNNWIYPYAPTAFAQEGTIYSDGTLGGVQATTGKTQWPYNLYDFPNGFPNPADPNQSGGSTDGVNHYFTVPGNHDEATILGTYNNASVNQVKFDTTYNGQPIGPDAYDYQNNIIKEPPYPPNGTKITSKTGSTQALLDYHAYLGAGNPGSLTPGSLNIGKLDPNGYGIYYSVDLGDAGNGKPLIHVTVIDTSRLLTDAGYYKFNFAPNASNTTRDPKTGLQTPGLTKILNYDVRDPGLTAADAWFQDPSVSLDDPSIGREMFLWAKTDLEQSDAAWNIVMGHHPAYHLGNPDANAEDSYTSNPAVLNFVQGLRDDTGASLFDAYMNGHSHAYSRVLEMAPSSDGIGTGIPFFTIGDGGKSLDALNLAPYGTDVLSPLNYGNLVGAKDGAPLYNYDINKYGTTADPNSEASALAPYQAGDPTSVGVSGYYTYSKVNWPVGTGFDGSNPAKLTITSVTTDPITGVAKVFDLDQPTYLSLLDPSQTDLSGLYGFGSGAAQLDAGDSYLMVHYQTAQPVDPAIALIGRGQGFTSFDPASLFYQQWSPSSAKVNDLALFSFDVDANGSLTNVQLVNNGNGYFEADPAAGSYLNTTQDFEILGNNPAKPLGFNNSDPTRAVVRLTFSGGQLTAVNLVNPGSDYQQVANAILQCNNCGSSTVQTDPDPKKNNSLLVGLNIDMQAQYTLASSRPTGSVPYHDWYLMTDTSLTGSSAGAGGSFGKVDLSLLPTSPQARQILAETPLTTGYTGTGPQQKYPAPQTGTLSLRDSQGELVGSATVVKGSAKVTLDRLPAPGPVNVVFGGDAASSYQVNFGAIKVGDNVTLDLNYGAWSGPVSQQGSQLSLAEAQAVQVTRTDSGAGLVKFGLANGQTSKVLARWAVGAKAGALQAGGLFGADPKTNWVSSEGRSEGGTGSATVAAGSWRPTAFQGGRELTLVSLQVEGNGALARFAAGNADDPSDDVLATFTLPATGTTSTGESGVLTVRRLSDKADGLALYEADPITGAVVDAKGRSWKPGQIGYLNAALDNAKKLGLVLKPEDMPGFGETAVRTDLGLQTDRNYGALLLVNGSEHNLLSSYAKANTLGSQQSLTLVAPGRGVSFGFEDKRPWQWGADRDFNDVIVTLTPTVPTLTA